jgi:hypothetical protein
MVETWHVVDGLPSMRLTRWTQYPQPVWFYYDKDAGKFSITTSKLAKKPQSPE